MKGSRARVGSIGVLKCKQEQLQARRTTSKSGRSNRAIGHIIPLTLREVLHH
jgi:hypothetical protein